MRLKLIPDLDGACADLNILSHKGDNITCFVFSGPLSKWLIYNFVNGRMGVIGSGYMPPPQIQFLILVSTLNSVIGLFLF